MPKEKPTAAQRAEEAIRSGDRDAFRRHFFMLDEHAPCECGHPFGEHDHPEGPCRELDSYDQPCACASYVEFRDDG